MADYTEKFESFWEAYPRKVGKHMAGKAFEKLDDEDKQFAIADVQKRSRMNWWSSTPKLIAHAATYLNQRRFEDEWEGDLQVRYEATAVVARRTIEENPGAGLDHWQRGANRITLLWLRVGHIAAERVAKLVEIKNRTLTEMRSGLDEEIEAGRGREASILLADMILSRLDMEFGTTRKNGILRRIL